METKNLFQRVYEIHTCVDGRDTLLAVRADFRKNRVSRPVKIIKEPKRAPLTFSEKRLTDYHLCVKLLYEIIAQRKFSRVS